MSNENENAKTPRPFSQEKYDELNNGLWQAFREAGRSSGGENRQAMAQITMALMKLQDYKPQ